MDMDKPVEGMAEEDKKPVVEGVEGDGMDEELEEGAEDEEAEKGEEVKKPEEGENPVV